MCYLHGHFLSPVCVSCVCADSLLGENLGLLTEDVFELIEARRGVELRMGVRRRSCWGERGDPIGGVGRVEPRTVLKYTNIK